MSSSCPSPTCWRRLRSALPQETGGATWRESRSVCEVQDVCVHAMFLNYASYFCAELPVCPAWSTACWTIRCRRWLQCPRTGRTTKTASLHTSGSVLEASHPYLEPGVGHRRVAVRLSRDDAVECLLARELFPVSQDRLAIRSGVHSAAPSGPLALRCSPYPRRPTRRARTRRPADGRRHRRVARASASGTGDGPQAGVTRARLTSATDAQPALPLDHLASPAGPAAFRSESCSVHVSPRD